MKDGRDGASLYPNRAARNCGIEDDLVERAAHDIPGVIGHLHTIFIAPYDLDPKVVLAVGSVEDHPVFDWVSLCLKGWAETEIFQRKGGCARERLAHMEARMNGPLHDHRRNALSQQMQRSGRTSRTAAKNYDQTFFVRHAFFRWQLSVNSRRMS
ncbi:MAG: hypothetical protein ABJB49_10515 [Nitrospirota bacterium]